MSPPACSKQAPWDWWRTQQEHSTKYRRSAEGVIVGCGVGAMSVLV